MATTSYLYHTMGLKNYRHLRTEYRQGTVFHHVRLKNTKRMCRAVPVGTICVRLGGSPGSSMHCPLEAEHKRSSFMDMNNIADDACVC
jgi:hypothetical protein